MDVQKIGELIRDQRIEQGKAVTNHEMWWNEPDELSYFALKIATEVAEADREINHANRNAFLVELADIILRTAKIATAFTPDFDRIILDKIVHNGTRNDKNKRLKA